ncbi:hypothetical protein PYCC9005_003706 [Savitreella phatthalungensis]
MSDGAAHFHFALARVVAMQLLRAAGVDRARSSVVESLTEVFIGVLRHLGLSARGAAELRGTGGRGCDVEDVLAAMETLRISADDLLTFAKGQVAQEHRRIAGQGTDDLGEAVDADWLRHLVEKQLKSAGEDRFTGTVLGDRRLNPGYTAHDEHLVDMDRIPKLEDLT